MNEEWNNNCSAGIVKEMKLMYTTNTTYSIGLKESYVLKINDENIIYEYQLPATIFVKLEINRNNLCMKIYKSENRKDWLEIDDEVEFQAIDLSNNGNRWEGCCMNGNPCGYGIIYDENNHASYRGYYFDDKKICFGEEYYDNGVVKYRGTYMNDYRHGYGCLYDKRGELIYEGEWSFNDNEGFDVNIPNDCVDDRLIHNLVCELTIGNNCYNDLSELKMNDYPNLSVFTVGSKCFTKTESFELTNCDNLKELIIGIQSMKNVRLCRLQSM